MKIQIQGGGCAKCRKLAENAREHVLLCLIPEEWVAGEPGLPNGLIP
jgi:hypothetical protein